MIVMDSNVASYIFRDSPEATFYQEQIEGQRVVISFQTLEELWYGAYNRDWGERRRAELASFLQQYEVIFPNAQLADICARLRAERRQSGREIKIADGWVAATALYLGCPLASHDGDFDGIPDLQLIKAPAP